MTFIDSVEPTLGSPSQLLVFRFFSTQEIFIPTPYYNFQSFLLTFLSETAIFTIVHHKEKEIVQSSTITMNYVNTKHMLSL